MLANWREYNERFFNLDNITDFSVVSDFGVTKGKLAVRANFLNGVAIWENDEMRVASYIELCEVSDKEEGYAIIREILNV